jgi:O-antigen ligase
MKPSIPRRVRMSGPTLVLLSILLGPISVIQVAGRTPTLFWCDVLLLAFFLLELGASTPAQTQNIAPEAGLSWLLGIYIVVALGSLLQAESLLLSVAHLKLRVMPLLSFSYIRRWYARFPNERRYFAVGLVVFACLLGLQIVWNYFLGSNSSLGAFDLGLEVRSTKDLAWTSFGRSNYLASLLILIIPIELVWFHRARSAWSRWFAGVAAGICGLSLLMTQSRGALISLAAGLLLYLVISFAQRASDARPVARGMRSFVVVCSLSFGAWFLVPDEVKEEFLRTFDFLLYQWREGNLAGNRSDIWRAGLAHVMDHPFIGIGLGNQQILKDSLGMDNTAHNLYLDTQLELGFLGLSALCCLLLAIVRRLYTRWRSESDPLESILRSGTLAALLIGLINCFQEPSFWAPQYSIVFWFLMGLGCMKTVAQNPLPPTGRQR